ncbi:MAG: DUF2608 domain-containing protein [Puniceicoccales bacterium]|jgi:hypothetical protein|nr:DUF2608 domain-containing protein [Puniceicoccales bacterium]
MIVTDTIEDIKKTLDGVDTDTLVVFDCDDVLTTLNGQLWKRKNHKFFADWCERNFPDCSVHTLYEVANSILVLSENLLVNEEMPKIVEGLYAKNVQAFVLTALSIKPIASVSDPLKWRVATLKEFGYDFGKFWPSLADKRFDGFAHDYPPAYSSGIVCSGEIPKGESFTAFVKYSGIKPARVIFIDDKDDTIENVEMACQALAIEFVGIRYLEADKIVSDVPFSEKMYDYQLATVTRKNVWVPDSDAARHCGITTLETSPT